MTQHITVTTEAPVNPETPTVTHYQKVADEFTKALDQIAVVVPQVDPAQYASAKVTRGQLRVPDQFCLTAIVTTEAIPALRTMGALDPVAVRDALQLLEAFRPVVDKIIAFGKSLKNTLDVKKAGIAVPSLQMYHFTKRLLRDAPSPELKAHVDNLKRDLDLRRLTKAEKEQRKAARLAAQKQKEVKAA